jgi:glycosyltransferase involved in cell wall biosynthesis
LNQDKGNYSSEIIVIDDGSTDDTPEICFQYSESIRYYRSENEGFTSSLTRAVKYATGDIVCLLDADDYFLPDKLNSIVELFDQKSSLLFLYHDQSFIDEEGNIIKTRVGGGNTSTHVFKREPAFDLIPAHGEQFFYTLYLAGRGKHLKKILSHYRIHAANMSKPRNIFTWKKKLLNMNVHQLTQIKSLIDHPPPWTSSKAMKYVYSYIASNYNFIKMEVALNRRNVKYAFKCYLRAMFWKLYSGRISFNLFKIGLTYFILKRYIKY